MSSFNNYLMTFTLKIEEAVTLVPGMTAEQKLKAVQHWNVVSEKLQDIVNSSAADIGALALELEKEKIDEKETNKLSVDDVLTSSTDVPSLPPEDRISLQPMSTEPYDDNDISSNDKYDCTSVELVNKEHIQDDPIPTEDETHSKRSPKKSLSLSKKLADIKEKENEFATVNGETESLVTLSERSPEPVTIDSNNKKQAEAIDEEVKNNHGNKIEDDDSSLEMDLQDNNNNSDEGENNGKENSSEFENTLDLDSMKSNTKGPYSCPSCNYTSTTKAQLRTHFSNHSKPFQCEQCNHRFSNKANLIVHIRRHTGERPFSCPTCLATFTTGGNLRRHQLIHTGKRPYNCEICNKAFTEKKTLKVHMRKHTGERPYECNFCGQTFSQLGILQSHVMRHMNTRDYLCDLCGKAFRQHSQLRSHQLRHEGEKKFVCSECNMKFITRGDLDRHKRRHTGERPYICEICGKTYTRQQSLNEHKNRHFGTKPYKCKFCTKTFYEMSACYKHIKIHDDYDGRNKKEKVEVIKKRQPSEEPAVQIPVDSNSLNVPQEYSASQTPSSENSCSDQLIEVENFSSPSKFLLLQMNGDALPERAASADSMNIADNVSQSACDNIPVVEFTSINMLSSRYPSTDSYS